MTKTFNVEPGHNKAGIKKKSLFRGLFKKNKKKTELKSKRRLSAHYIYSGMFKSTKMTLALEQ